MIPKMDYIVVTLNDADTIMATIESIKKQGNLNRLIVVASERCTDGTLNKLEVLQLFEDADVDVLLTENVGLAYARKIAIQEVETEWFVFVDADVVLSDTWMEEMHVYMQYYSDSELGALFGHLYRNDDQKTDLEEHGSVKNVKSRMFTHNTIIRTKIVEDWDPDNIVNAYEDYLLTQHIIAKGYTCFNVNVLSFHDHRGSTWKESTWAGAGAKISGCYKNIWAPMKYLVGNMYGGLKRTIRQRKWSFLKVATIRGFGMFWGYLRWENYIKK